GAGETPFPGAAQRRYGGACSTARRGLSRQAAGPVVATGCQPVALAPATGWQPLATKYSPAALARRAPPGNAACLSRPPRKPGGAGGHSLCHGRARGERCGTALPHRAVAVRLRPGRSGAGADPAPVPGGDGRARGGAGPALPGESRQTAAVPVAG